MRKPKFYGGREFTPEEIDEVIDTVKMFPDLSLTELADTICEHLEWFSPTGTYKREACLNMLESLESRKRINLPDKAVYQHKNDKRIRLTPRTEPRPILETDIREIGNVRVEPVLDMDTKHLWNEYMERYHFLGHKKPFGVRQRYFILSDAGYLGCILIAGAAKAMTCRDTWIGWTKAQRIDNIYQVVNNARFLIFPWVRVKNLASQALSLATRRLRSDWLNQWEYDPVLIETFVDPAEYQGTCYKAANWVYLGMTTGVGNIRKGKTYTTTPKMVFVLPLEKNFRIRLCKDKENL